MQSKGSGLTEAEMIRLMNTYSDMLYGLCRSLLSDSHLAYDAVQETFLRVWKQPRFSPTSEKAWLIRIAINLCGYYHRCRCFLHMDRRTPIEEMPLAAPEGPDRGLWDMVQHLPLKEKEVVLMHYWQNLSADEIASTLDLNRATVYRRLEKAQKHLRLEYEEDNE